MLLILPMMTMSEAYSRSISLDEGRVWRLGRGVLLYQWKQVYVFVWNEVYIYDKGTGIKKKILINGF